VTAERCAFDRNEADAGGAVSAAASDVSLIDCRLTSNRAGRGGAVHADRGSTVRVAGCTLVGNEATGFGGALALRGGSTAHLDRVTVHGSASPAGSVVHLAAGCTAAIDRALMTDSRGGAAIDGIAANARLTRSDLFGNEGGAWAGSVRGLERWDERGGNFSADPGYCDAGTGDLRLGFGSPCAAEVRGGLPVGAHDVGCARAAADELPAFRLEYRRRPAGRSR
jgi:hypothetical protein